MVVPAYAAPAPRRVLVVDDRPDVLALLTRMLEKAGFDVEKARNGRAAIELATRGQPFDVVVLWSSACLTAHNQAESRPAYSTDACSTMADTELEVRPVPPPIPAFPWTGSLSPLLLVPMLVPIVVALIAPTDVLHVVPLARAFTKWVARAAPFFPLSTYADSTRYPQLALLVHSIVVVVIAITAVVWLVQSWINYPHLLARAKARGGTTLGQHLLVLVVAPPFFFWMD